MAAPIVNYCNYARPIILTYKYSKYCQGLYWQFKFHLSLFFQLPWILSILCCSEREPAQRGIMEIFWLFGDLDKVAITGEQLDTTEVVLKTLKTTQRGQQRPCCPDGRTSPAKITQRTPWKIIQSFYVGVWKIEGTIKTAQLQGSNVFFRRFHRLRGASMPLSKHIELLLKSLCPEPADFRAGQRQRASHPPAP